MRPGKREDVSCDEKPLVHMPVNGLSQQRSRKSVFPRYLKKDGLDEGRRESAKADSVLAANVGPGRLHQSRCQRVNLDSS